MGNSFMFQGTLLIDFDVNTMLRALRIPLEKLKDKWTDHYQRKSLKDNVQFVYANLIERSANRKRVKTKRIMAENLSIGEALDKFDEISEPYLIFKNIETDRINVLVKKDDEHYKLIEP